MEPKPDPGNSPPEEWTREIDEKEQAEILEQLQAERTFWVAMHEDDEDGDD